MRMRITGSLWRLRMEVSRDNEKPRTIDSGKDDIKHILGKKGALPMGKPKVLFIDEIHRFNKAQQDFLLPYVERGDLTLIGATTENPSFEIISALLSRCRVFVLNELREKEMALVIER